MIPKTFLLHDFMLFAPVRIASFTGYAHLDTGARHSSLLQSYSEPFEQIGSREMLAAFGTASVPQVRLGEIEFLDQVFQDVPVDVLPDHVGGFNMLPFKVILSLGSDVLLQNRLYLDFPRSTLRFLDAYPPHATTQVQVEANFRFGPPLFKMTLGEQSLVTVFDTGAGMSAIHLSTLERFRNEMVEDEPVEAEDPTGARFTIPTFRCRTLRLGDSTLEECRFLAIDLSSVEQKTGQAVDFVFGVNAMMHKGWFLDRQRSLIEMI